VAVKRFILRGGSHDGERQSSRVHPDSLFSVDDPEAGEVYARVADEHDDQGVWAVFQYDPSGELVERAKSRFAP
jgi:hypothetical protein